MAALLVTATIDIGTEYRGKFAQQGRAEDR